MYFAKLPILVISFTVNLQCPGPSFIRRPLDICSRYLVFINLILQCIPK
uniref:Uncharacterized protein n=1 Tax=Podoviridae sp. ct2m58 TaxID=2827721 RepID=A0A8S5TMQ1_9CAUD|nr:MAG TPA: hypothetical protein [Podoviridae sp. ct2m58]